MVTKEIAAALWLTSTLEGEHALPDLASLTLKGRVKKGKWEGGQGLLTHEAWDRETIVLYSELNGLR